MLSRANDKIERILGVVDTREYEEVGDRWVPIRGSGVENECSRCHRLHEIHVRVLVRREDGSSHEEIVGQSCSRAKSMMRNEIIKAIGSSVATIQTLSALRAEMAMGLDRRAAWLADYEAELAKVGEWKVKVKDADPVSRRWSEGSIYYDELPDLHVVFGVLTADEMRQFIEAGPGLSSNRAVSAAKADEARERLECLRDSAARNLLSAEGRKTYNPFGEAAENDIRRRIARAEARLAKLIEASATPC